MGQLTRGEINEEKDLRVPNHTLGIPTRPNTPESVHFLFEIEEKVEIEVSSFCFLAGKTESKATRKRGSNSKSQVIPR